MWCSTGYLQLGLNMLTLASNKCNLRKVIRIWSSGLQRKLLSVQFQKFSSSILFLLFSLLAQIAPVNGALCFYGGMLSYQILAIKLRVIHFRGNSSTFGHSIISHKQPNRTSPSTSGFVPSALRHYWYQFWTVMMLHHCASEQKLKKKKNGHMMT